MPDITVTGKKSTSLTPCSEGQLSCHLSPADQAVLERWALTTWLCRGKQCHSHAEVACVGARPEGSEQQACGSSKQPGTTDSLLVWVLKPMSWGLAASNFKQCMGDKAGHWRCALKACIGTLPVLPLSWPL